MVEDDVQNDSPEGAAVDASPEADTERAERRHFTSARRARFERRRQEDGTWTWTCFRRRHSLLLDSLDACMTCVITRTSTYSAYE